MFTTNREALGQKVATVDCFHGRYRAMLYCVVERGEGIKPRPYWHQVRQIGPARKRAEDAEVDAYASPYPVRLDIHHMEPVPTEEQVVMQTLQTVGV